MKNTPDNTNDSLPDTALAASPADKARVGELIARHKRGGLTPSEAAELDRYMSLEPPMRLKKARARRSEGAA